MAEVALTPRGPGLVRRKIRVRGIVQGVGFRPFVYVTASRWGVTGFVGNDSGGVFIEVQGNGQHVAGFESSLRTEAPPLARVDEVLAEWTAIDTEEDEFTIVESNAGSAAATLIPPDIATCDECREDFRSPENRRHGYAFTNCTNCGPRYSIIRALPYDRPATTMEAFEMCADCAAEYTSPLDRRFHAQPNACSNCGPTVSFRMGDQVLTESSIELAAKMLAEGAILAIKGIGGYHLACDARNSSSVATLRTRKNRDAKPFAVMVQTIETARTLASTSPEDEVLLLSPQRPVVLLDQREANGIAAEVAPANHRLGIFLSYSPLHDLLLEALASALGRPDPAIVLTSGNLSDEPIVYQDDDARTRLGAIADGILDHNRPIVAHCDDSVVRSTRFGPQLLRRSRGYAPTPIRVAGHAAKTILACGGQLKNTVTYLRGDDAYVSPHIGDLHSLKTMEAFERIMTHYEEIFGLTPEVVAYDLHPGYASSRFALALDGVEKIGVQHHEAHVASVMAEARLSDDVIGIAADGTGYGRDGTLWGGEVFIGGWTGFERFSHLEPVPLPGNEKAVREPWRMALTYLELAYGAESMNLALPAAKDWDMNAWSVLSRMIQRKVQSPLTSSLGRVFDAVSAILGQVPVSRYEGQAAIAIERLAASAHRSGTAQRGVPTYEADLGTQISLAPMIRGIVDDVLRGTDPALIALGFHTSVAEAFVRTAMHARDETGLSTVVLSGGVFQNQLLSELMVDRLRAEGMEPHLNRLVPANDGGLSLGQAAIAAASTGLS